MKQNTTSQSPNIKAPPKKSGTFTPEAGLTDILNKERVTLKNLISAQVTVEGKNTV